MSELVLILSIITTMIAIVFGLINIVITYLYNKKKLGLDEKIYELNMGMKSIELFTKTNPEFNNIMTTMLKKTMKLQPEDAKIFEDFVKGFDNYYKQEKGKNK